MTPEPPILVEDHLQQRDEDLLTVRIVLDLLPSNYDHEVNTLPPGNGKKGAVKKSCKRSAVFITSRNNRINPWPLVPKFVWLLLVYVATSNCAFNQLFSWYDLYAHQPGPCGISDPQFLNHIWLLISFSSAATFTLGCYLYFYFKMLSKYIQDLVNSRPAVKDEQFTFPSLVGLILLELASLGSALSTLFVHGTAPLCDNPIVSYCASVTYFVPSLTILTLGILYLTFAILRWCICKYYVRETVAT